MDKKAQVEQLTTYMANFVSYIGKVLPDDIKAKINELAEKEDSPLSKTIYQTMKLNQKLAESGKGFYELLENQEVDELVTGLALKQGLKPVYLKIENTTPGIPAAYQTVVKSKDSDDTTGSDSHSGSSILKYVNTTTVSITLQGSEQQIRAMLDDIARNYPGVQVRSFHMEESTYVDDSLQQVSQNNCECTMAVYTCGELGK